MLKAFRTGKPGLGKEASTRSLSLRFLFQHDQQPKRVATQQMRTETTEQTASWY